MSVHVDELHTDIVPTGAEPAKPRESGDRPLGAGIEQWQHARRDTKRLAHRVAAEGFDD